ncbi:MAG: hypothetical protein J7L58_01565 [Thermoplasmata archaeon]|nr:hypothetical protein [Thermoplasmata archaeon]
MDDEEIVRFIKERLQKRKLEEMNKELREWMEEQGIKIEKEGKEEEEKIEGKCEICEIREAKYRCIRCGKIACMSCFWSMLGICKECITEKQMKELKEQHYF